MRDIKPHKKNIRRHLPPPGESDYEDIELYEASTQPNQTRRQPPLNHAQTTVQTKPKLKPSRTTGRNVPVSHVSVGSTTGVATPSPQQKTKTNRRLIHHPRASSKPLGSVQVGKSEHKVILTLLTLIFIAAIIASLIFLPTVNIEMSLATAPLLIHEKIIIGADGTNTVPGTSFSKEVTLTGSHQVTNKEMIGSKSKGEVDIINKTLSKQSIKEQSRLVTTNGTLFYLDTHAIIPPNSSQRVNVTAATEGDSSNIEPQRLNFAGLDESSQSVVYAQAVSKFTGGSGQEVAVLSEQDMAKAKEEAALKAKEQAQQLITSDQLSHWTLLPESWDMTINEFNSQQEVGDKTPLMNYQARVTTRVMGFDQAVFEEKMRAKLEKNISNDYMLFPGPISYTPSVDEVDWDNSTATVDSRITHSTIAKLSLASLKDKLAGRSAKQAQEYLEGLPGVRSANMKLWPFWVRSIPRIESRINLDLQPEKKI